MLAWLSIWSEVQTCIWPSWCHCHSLSLASVKSRLVFPFWYWLTPVVPEKVPLNGCVCVCVMSEWVLLSNITFASLCYMSDQTRLFLGLWGCEAACPRDWLSCVTILLWVDRVHCRYTSGPTCTSASILTPVCVCLPDTQVVPHVLWPASSDRVPADVTCAPAKTSPSYSPRGATRHLLLHHDRLAQLPVWNDQLLASSGGAHHGADRGNTAVGRHGLGTEDRITGHKHEPAGHFLYMPRPQQCRFVQLCFVSPVVLFCVIESITIHVVCWQPLELHHWIVSLP